MKMNFRTELRELKDNEDNYLANSNRTSQREFIRLKSKNKWLLVEMMQPTLTVIKNFKKSPISGTEDIFE